MKKEHIQKKGFELACFNLPNLPTAIIGVQYSYVKNGTPRVAFWQPPYKHYPYQIWHWEPKTSSWRLSKAKLSESMESKFSKFWEDQEDIGLWIAHLKRLNNFKPKEQRSTNVAA
jgi:hypothetical protein